MSRAGAVDGHVAVKRGLAAWMLAAIIAASLPALAVDLHLLAPQHAMEGFALLSSRETWQRQHQGESDAWLAPSLNGSPRLRKPPMVIWLHMLSWTGLDPQTAAAETLIERARLVSAGCGVIMVLATFWIGCAIRDRELGLIGAAVAGSMMLLQHQARMATYDMPLTAFSTLSAAAALWALGVFEPTSPKVGRVWLGVLVAGLVGAAAVLCKGAAAILLIGTPVLVVMALDRRRWISRGLAIAGMLSIMVLAAGWWFVYIEQRYPRVVEVLDEEYRMLTVTPRPPLHYLKLMWWVALPWSIWVVAGMIHPLTAAPDEWRSRRMAVWLWFICLLVALSIPEAKEKRYLAMLGPALALLIGWVWRDHLSKARSGERDPKARWFIDPHWASALVISGSLASLVAGNAIWVRKDWLRDEIIEPAHIGWAAALGVILAALAVAGWRQHRRGNVPYALAAMTAFGSLSGFAYWKAYAHTRDPMASAAIGAGHVKGIVGSAPVFYLAKERGKHPSFEFIFYLRRTVARLPERDLKRNRGAVEDGAEHYVITTDAAAHQQTMIDAGYGFVLRFSDGRSGDRLLWRGLRATAAAK